MRSKKFRIQKDSVKAVNVSMALFIKLLTKSCELLHSNTIPEGSAARMRNTLDIGDLVKVVHRYDVLEFLKDLVDEMDVPSVPVTSDKRKTYMEDDAVVQDIAADEEEVPRQTAKKPKVIQQGSIISFFNKAANKVPVNEEVEVISSD